MAKESREVEERSGGGVGEGPGGACAPVLSSAVAAKDQGPARVRGLASAGGGFATFGGAPARPFRP